MEELVKYIAQHLVESPDEVKTTVKEQEDSIVIELSVAPDDMGRIIGKQGRIAKAIRSVVRAASPREGKRYLVDIV